jgi:hypothetical protein
MLSLASTAPIEVSLAAVDPAEARSDRARILMAPPLADLE